MNIKIKLKNPKHCEECPFYDNDFLDEGNDYCKYYKGIVRMGNRPQICIKENGK